jgi:hypothetical protein
MAGYETVEEVLAARAALEASMPGWQPPVAYALGVERDRGGIEWRVTNHPNVHQLPAVCLGKVLGHCNGSATYWLDLATFDEAIALLEPAGTCDAFDHPNLWAWQKLRAELAGSALPDGTRIVAVFIGSIDDPVVDDAQRQLRETLGLG